MEKELILAYYKNHEWELEEKYLKEDPGYQEREKELKEAVAVLEPLLQELGHEIWLKVDRVFTAHNQCEAYALQAMYVKGVMDACQIFCPARREEKYGRN